METFTIVLCALLALSEVLALIPSIKANSIFQTVYNILRGLNPRGTPQ